VGGFAIAKMACGLRLEGRLTEGGLETRPAGMRDATFSCLCCAGVPVQGVLQSQHQRRVRVGYETRMVLIASAHVNSAVCSPLSIRRHHSNVQLSSSTDHRARAQRRNARVRTKTNSIMAPKKNQATAAEISVVHLQNCLVNLPASLASLLATVNTVSSPAARNCCRHRI